jgi:tRNA A37 threonylcarbamoyladenosine dehydratase
MKIEYLLRAGMKKMELFNLSNIKLSHTNVEAHGTSVIVPDVIKK